MYKQKRNSRLKHIPKKSSFANRATSPSVITHPFLLLKLGQIYIFVVETLDMCALDMTSSNGKIGMLSFVTLTLVLTILLSYNMYLSFGVAHALNQIELSVQQIILTNSTMTYLNFTIQNPSEFAFKAVLMQEAFFLKQIKVGERQGKKGLSLTIDPFSTTNLTTQGDDFKYYVDYEHLESLGGQQKENWIVSVDITLKTPLPKRQQLHFEKEPSSVALVRTISD